VVCGIRRKFGVQVTRFDECLGTFDTIFEGPINLNEVFMRYSRKLSKTARKCIKSMDVCRIEGSVREPLNKRSAFMRNHDECFIPEGVGAGVNSLELDEMLRWMEFADDEGFRLDAAPYMFGDRILIV
jgi:hypothetical protein